MATVEVLVLRLLLEKLPKAPALLSHKGTKVNVFYTIAKKSDIYSNIPIGILLGLMKISCTACLQAFMFTL